MTLRVPNGRQNDFQSAIAWTQHQLRGEVTAAAVGLHLSGIVTGEIRRFELPKLGALQFVCECALNGGVTTSLALDAHGKSLSYALLEMPIVSSQE